jgi:tetratricopeptide (TPR) repeat protein
VALGLALANFTWFSSWGVIGAPGSTNTDLQKAADLLRPFVRSPGSSRQTRLVYADVLNYLSHRQPKETAIATCEESRKILVDLGALDLSDLRAASEYADTSDSEARHSMVLGRLADAERLEKEVYDIAEKVLVLRPGDLRSMGNRALAADVLGQLAMRRHDYVTATEFAAKYTQAGEHYVRFNPSDLGAWMYWIRGKAMLSDVLFEQGRIAESNAALRDALALGDDPRRPSSLQLQLWSSWQDMAFAEANSGQRAAAERSLKQAAVGIGETIAPEPQGSPRRTLLPMFQDGYRALLQLMYGEYQASFDESSALVKRINRVKLPDDATGRGIRANALRFALGLEAQAGIRLGRYPEAEAAVRDRLTLPPNPFSESNPQEELSRSHVTLAWAVAKQGRVDEARVVLQPELARYLEAQKNGASGTTFRNDLAQALYVSALAQPADAAGRARRDAALAEATRVIAGQSAEVRQLMTVRELQSRIAAARSGS